MHRSSRRRRRRRGVQMPARPAPTPVPARTPDPAHPQPILVLGLGNRLLSDEGVGVLAAEELATMGLDGVDVLDGGTLGLALLPSIEGREALLVLDAVSSAQAQPGQVLVLAGDALRRTWRRCMSAHQLGITDSLAVAELAGQAPTEVVAVCMVPHSLEIGWGLSASALEQLPRMVETARGVLRGWGVENA